MLRRGFLKFGALASAGTLFSTQLFASAAKDNFISVGAKEGVSEVSKKMLEEIFSANEYYVKQKGSEFFEAFKNGQKPRATVVGCSDSRFQTAALDSTPENDLFVIRNIGNQFTSNEGSVEYGVHHLHTPLLIIVGHSRCGAIKAALGDYSKESSAIRREVDYLASSIKATKFYPDEATKWLQAVVQNVSQQVLFAKAKFSEEVVSGKLTIVGVVFDLANDFKEGAGKLKVVCVNGETDQAKLRAMPALKGLKI